MRAEIVSGPGVGTRDATLVMETLPIQTGKHLVAPYGF